METKTKIVVSRKWHLPQIEAYVSREEVGAKIDVEDFIKALAEEIGKPTWILTRKQLLAKLKAAADNVVHEVKSKTAHVV